MVAQTERDPNTVLVVRIQDIKPLPEPDEHEHTISLKILKATGCDDPLGKLHQCIGVLQCEVLGRFYRQAPKQKSPHFSSSLALSEPAQAWGLYRPDQATMEMLTNGTVSPDGRIEFGLLRSSEDISYLEIPHPTHVSMFDIRGKRTAMFGKTRLGKSNVVKLIAQGILDVTENDPHIGQVIFDVNGEYANSNPQDGDDAIATAYKERCLPYFLTDLNGNPDAKLLRFNFYERSQDALDVLRELLPQDVIDTPEVRGFFTVRLPSMERHPDERDTEFQRRLRKLMLYWAILDSAGFDNDSDRMKAWIQAKGMQLPFNPGFSTTLRKSAYLAVYNTPPPSLPFNFSSMATEMRVIARFSLMYPNDPALNSNGQFIFDGDERILVDFLCQSVGMGTAVLRPTLQYHSPTATDFTRDILNALDQSKTVVINLGSANEQIIRYFAKSICLSIFREQERKFVSNELHDRYVQIYFEEAHMIFPPNSGDVINVYSRFAKEGAKFNIGIVYCTQSPTTVNRDLLSQTENFFIGHLSSEAETTYLGTVQTAFQGCEASILRSRTAGYMHVLTHSHRYVVPMQAHRYNGQSRITQASLKTR